MAKNILKDFFETPAIEKVVRIAGGTAKVADLMGVTQKTVREWMKDPRKVPGSRAIELSLLTLNMIPPSAFRPDLFKNSESQNENVPHLFPATDTRNYAVGV